MTRKIFFALVIAMATIGLIGCGKDQSEKVGFIRERVSVVLHEVEQTDLEETVKFTGRLEGEMDIMVFPQMPGTIERIFVDVGEKVPQGRLLVRMKGETLQQAQAQFEAAEQTYERMKSLYEDSLIAPQSYDQARAGYLAAKAGYHQVLDNTELRAPFAGTIVGKYFNEHDVYAPGMRGIVRLATTERLKLPVTIAAKDFRRLSPGMSARITCEVFPDTTFDGKLDHLSPGADPITGLFSGDIILENKGGRLPVGVFVEAEVIVNVIDNALVVPRTSIVADSIAFVFSGGKVERRVVETGLMTSRIVQLTSGVKAGEMVVSRGAVGLRDGLEVHVAGEVGK
ncbi:MAG TPA: efflux RND transporter periplasmic adaptor subunit [candidate division Zixibacteria bacterium]|nr:efflux RND transporter periplasmic adaptor subunit [candidate division Zixibacteria bacterium]